MATSFSEVLSQSITENSIMLTPPNLQGKRKISLSVRDSAKKRKNLAIFLKNETSDDEDKRSPLVANVRDSQEDVQDFKITLNSVHEINSRSYNPDKAFNYNLINKLDSIVRNKSDFKTFGVALDAGTKIYSSKVDLLYDGAQKISSSLAMATDEQNMSLNDDVSDNGGLNARKKRPKPKKNVDTIVSNIETINSKLDTNIPIDPLFHHLSAAFDVGNVGSLLMANLCIDPSGSLLLDSNVSLNFDSYPKVPSKTLSFPFLRLEYAFENLFVCQHFRDFEFLRRDLTVEIEEIQTQKADTDTGLDFGFDINTDVDVIHNSGELDLDDFPVDISDEREDRKNDPSDQDESAEQNLLGFLPEIDENNQFFSRNFLKSTFKKKYGCFADDKKKKPVQKKARTQFSYNDYNHSKDFLNEVYTYNECTTYCAQSIQKWTVSTQSDRMDALFTDSDLFWRRCLTKNLLFDDVWAFHRNKNPTKCVNDGDDDDDCREDFFHNDHDDYDDVNVRHGSNMLSDNFEPGRTPFDLEVNTDDQQPLHVDALDIDYAKVAKKIDIKKVKVGMWDYIQKSSTEIIDYTDEPMSSGSSQKNIKFSCLRQNLPTLLKSNINENLSTPISFVALLHLCNEKTLKLEKEQNYGDFVIQPEN